MTSDDIIDGILLKEGGWRDEKIRPNAPPDPATMRGVTFPTLKWYHQRHNLPSATLDDLRALTADSAGRILRELFIDEPGFTAAAIPFEPLRVQLIDFGVNSGPERAVRWLQRVLRFEEKLVTGKMDRVTIQTLNNGYVDVNDDSGMSVPFLAIVNDALVAARSYMIDRAVDQGIMRRQDEEGVESRALSFFLAKP